MPLKLTSDPLENERELSRIAEDGRAKFKSSWGQNLKHLSGLLIDATQETLSTVSGAYRSALSARSLTKITGEPVALDLIRPRAQRFIARHLALMGGVKAIAATGDGPDKRQAKAAERQMQVIWENKSLDVTVMQALVYMLAMKHGYVLIEGDPKAGLRIKEDENGTPQAYEQGDLIYKALTALQVSCYPGLENIHDSPAIVIEDFLTADELKRRWNIVAPDEAETASYGVTELDELIPELHKVAYKAKRLFIKPSPAFLLGEHHVILGGKVMHSTKEADGRNSIGTYGFRYPIIDFSDAPIGFGYEGEGRQSSARTVIKILSATWSRMVQCAIGMPAVVVDVPEGTAEEKLANKAYLLFYRNPQGGPMGFSAVPRLPHHESMINFCIRWLDEIYAQSPSSRGQTPGPRFPAKGLEFLAQQDVLADTPTGKMVLKALQQLFRQALGEALRVWDDEHIEYILGEGRELEKIALKKGELKQGWDIFVVPGSGSLSSPEAQRQQINESVKAGILSPIDARRLAGYHVKEEVFEPKRAQTRVIGLEEEKLEQGLFVDINEYDEHPLHFAEHRKSQARRHGIASDLERTERQRHQVKHTDAMGLESQALLADQKAAELEAQFEQGAEGLGGGEEPAGEGSEEPPDQAALDAELEGLDVGAGEIGVEA